MVQNTQRKSQQYCIVARRVKGQFCSLGILLCASDHADNCVNNTSTGKPEGYFNMDRRRQLTLPTTASSMGDDGEVAYKISVMQ